MYCIADVMGRKRRSYNLDERLIDAITELAKDANLSANKYLENLLFAHSVQTGKLPINARPLGEIRGGDFSKKKDSTTEESSNNAT